MSKDIPFQLKQEFDKFCQEILGKLAQDTADYDTLITLWRQELHNAYLESTAKMLEQWAEAYGQSDNLDRIEADDITVEVSDHKTGKVFRRSLPVKYIETANGVILHGETLAGQPSTIALLSDFACAKISDVTGRGADSPRDHEHE
ncbi:hypothetical protein Ga0466249_003432 [Sporomusaceae bacterium BoRhaA]|uniref:hypothetical protein n=1 Tax=Pelorhabdus rhamnosifermentans TaxID=2772457 RepID=UPI001C06223C|nr:hypothetical protein [Pelorhabdus rhamnosifermentans]MBU2702305.1 hypothetical protein [Pelorhabdus rhamnosifermentans]